MRAFAGLTAWMQQRLSSFWQSGDKLAVVRRQYFAGQCPSDPPAVRQLPALGDRFLVVVDAGMSMEVVRRLL